MEDSNIEYDPRRFAGWYSNTHSRVEIDGLLERTFEHAKLILSSALKPKDYESLFPTPTGGIPPIHSVQTVLSVISEAQDTYECRTGLRQDVFRPMEVGTDSGPTGTGAISIMSKYRSKTRMWLTGMSEKVMFYGNVFDVVAQNFPEYVSLAWGTFKLVFQAIINHAETASKLSKAIFQIADLLPRQELHLLLYSTPKMQASVARLYALILNFFCMSLKWYGDNRAMHALKSIFQPWDLKFRDAYDAISAEAHNIERLADVALKAEIRDTRIKIVESAEQWSLARREIDSLRSDNQRLMNAMQASLDDFKGSMLSIYTEIHVDLRSHNATLNTLHLNQMLSLPLWQNLKSSGETLMWCRSLRDRRRSPTRISRLDIQKLNNWHSSSHNSVLLFNSLVSGVAKTFLVDCIELMQASEVPVIWALRFPGYQEQRMLATDIMRMLTLQLMQLRVNSLLNTPFPISVEHLLDASSISDWAAILDRLLRSLGRVFIIIDPDLMGRATENERTRAVEVIEALRLRLCASPVNIVTAVGCVTQTYVDELRAEEACVKINADRESNRRRRRKPHRSGNSFERVHL